MTRGRVAAALAALASLAIYLSRLDQAAGLYIDDAWYIVLAKAIAQGDGYLLISSATTPILPTFPPGFPLMLAPVVAVFPDFPDNVAMLKAAGGIVPMFAVAWAAFVYLRRYRDAPPAVAGAVALATLLMPAFVFLATSTIMAEPAFTLGQIALAVSVERTVRAQRSATPMACVSGVLAGAAILVRMAGVAAALAAAWYLWRHRRQPALVFAAVTAACYLPWAAYAAMHANTVEERLAHGGSIAHRYDELLAMRVGASPGAGRATAADLPPRIFGNIVSIFARDLGAQVLPSGYRGADESGQEVFLVSGESGFRATGMGTGAQILALSSLVAAVMLAGFVAAWRRGARVSDWIVLATIGMVLLVPVPTYRYILPLAPFLLFYFFCGVDAIAARVRRVPGWTFGAPFRVSAACILVLFVFDHLQYAQLARAGKTTWQWAHEEVAGVTDWMNANLPPGPVTTSNPGLLWLSTGRKAVVLSYPEKHWAEWRASGIRYAVALKVLEKPSRSLGYQVLYESPRYKLWAVDIPGAPDRK